MRLVVWNAEDFRAVVLSLQIARRIQEESLQQWPSVRSSYALNGRHICSDLATVALRVQERVYARLFAPSCGAWAACTIVVAALQAHRRLQSVDTNPSACPSTSTLAASLCVEKI